MRSGSSFLRSGVARRLLLLFLLTALVPVSVAAWLSHSAVAQLSAQADTRLLGQTTRQVALQVFARMIVAKGLLETWPAEPAPQAGHHDGPLPGQGRLFRSIARLDPQGRLLWAQGEGDLLADRWRAQQAGVTATPGHAPTADATPEVHLRLLGAPGSTPRIVLAVGPAQAPRWLAALEGDFLWSPITESGDAAWTVADAHGSPLVAFRADDEAKWDPSTLQTARWTLFLGGEFGEGSWVFVQRQPSTVALWAGQPLELWLALVAAATVLGVALLSLSQIRRTLGPLTQLISGTRRLAGGDTAARVPLQTRDEFGDLARSFNHMAGRIEQQWRSLQVLAEIDRDILQRADIPAVSAHVLAALRSLQPGARAALMWLDDPASEVLEGMAQGPRDAVPRGVPPRRLTAAQRRHLLALHTDHTLEGDALAPAADTPWLAPVVRPKVAQLVCLPVRWGGITQAVLLLGLRRKVDLAVLQPAMDLRERLAVAFTARERDRALMHRALHDSLTGLANRHGLHERLDELLGEASACALLFIDLDRFKQVNDTHGHAAGDELLRQASQRLALLVPENALVARPGGDEFVIAWPGAGHEEALRLGQAVCARLALPFHLRGSDHFLGASVGVAHAPDHATSRDELMRAADLAMYAAKGQGRGRCVVFTPVLDAQLRERLQLQTELRHAIGNGELRLHYQPRVRPQDGRITSAEALVRWQHPERGLLFPGTFIPLAEESELIESLGLWVLDEACAQMARWQASGVGLPRVSVNVSPRQLASGTLLHDVRATLDRHGIAPQALELEVTESLLVGDASGAREQLAELRRWGLTIALDDFGTGYSSMSTLRELPIDVMKVDRAFIKDLGLDDAALAVTRAILALADSLHMHTVAEGIETEAQAATLRELGCDELQGYLYAKPLPPEQFAALPGLVPAVPLAPRRAAPALA